MAHKVLNLLWNLAHSDDVPVDIMDQALSAHIKILDYSCSQVTPVWEGVCLLGCVLLVRVEECVCVRLVRCVCCCGPTQQRVQTVCFCSQDRDTQKIQWIDRFIEELRTNDKWVIPALKQIREICSLFGEAPQNLR